MTDTVTAEYLDGIREGRAMLRADPTCDKRAILANVEATIKGFAASSPVGQLLRGERDFWRNQIRKEAA